MSPLWPATHLPPLVLLVPAGDAFCDASRGETISSCPIDCPGTCGDGICNANFGELPHKRVMVSYMHWRALSRFQGPLPHAHHTQGHLSASENPLSRPCLAHPLLAETAKTCPQDCPGTCGDAYCNTFFESCSNCLVVGAGPRGRLQCISPTPHVTCDGCRYSCLVVGVGPPCFSSSPAPHAICHGCWARLTVPCLSSPQTHACKHTAAC